MGISDPAQKWLVILYLPLVFGWYQLVVVNTGPDPVTNTVVYTSDFALGADPGACDPQIWAPELSIYLSRCTIGTLAPGGSASVLLNYNPMPGAHPVQAYAKGDNGAFVTLTKTITTLYLPLLTR